MPKQIIIEELENLEMENESGKKKRYEQCMNPGRAKYIRQVDGPKVYPMGRHTFDKLAREAGAVLRYSGLVLVDTKVLDDFLDSNFREPSTLI